MCADQKQPVLAAVAAAISIVLLPLAFAPNVGAQESGPAYTGASEAQNEESFEHGNIETKVTRTTDGKVVVTQYSKNRGGFEAFFTSLIFGPRIGLERNEGRKVYWFEYVRGIPYVGWATVPYMCYEALSGFKMQEVANRTGLDDERRVAYDAAIKSLEEKDENSTAQALREQDPFKPENHPLDPQARMPQQGLGGRMKSALAGILVDRRAGLERNESRGIMTHEWFHYLIIPTLGDAVKAYQGETMTEVARHNHLDKAWLQYNIEHGEGRPQPATPAPNDTLREESGAPVPVSIPSTEHSTGGSTVRDAQ